jgi:DNA-binding transcriptional regulator YhcF (GntR family)
MAKDTKISDIDWDKFHQETREKMQKLAETALEALRQKGMPEEEIQKMLAKKRRKRSRHT